MTHTSWLRASERWFRLLLWLYPLDFREEMGPAIVQLYVERTTSTLNSAGLRGVMWLWLRALVDSLWNGIGERLRPAAAWRRAARWGRDLHLTRRRLLRSPAFAAATLGTLTVGLGAFAVVYTAVDKVLIRRLAYRDADDLYVVWRDQSASGGLRREWLAGPDVAELQKARGAIESAIGTQLVTPTLSVQRDGEPLPTLTMLTSPTLFDLLGVQPMLGRPFAASEVGPRRPSVVVLSHSLWKRLGAKPSLVGAQVWLSGLPYTVIGVMGPDFRFVRHATLGPGQEPDVFMPFRFNVADQKPNAVSFGALIRVRPGTSPQQVSAVVDGVARAVNDRNRQPTPVRLEAIRLQDDLVAPVKPILLTLGAAGVVLLLVLTVNLSSLLLARAAEREREFAVSRALGANGAAVVRAMVIEGGVLGFIGGLAGALVGSWGARLLVALAPLDLPRRGEIVLDWGVAMVVTSVGLAIGMLSAAAPAAWASRASLSSLLAASNVRGAGGTQRMRRGIVVLQVALTLVLLSAGGLVARSLQLLLATDAGFRPAGVLTFSVAMGPRLFPKTADAFAFQDRVETALRALPGVTGVSATSALPLNPSAEQATISIPGAPGATGDRQRDAVLVDVIATRADYPRVMGMRVLNGRGFERARPADVAEALIDQHLAHQFFPTGTPIGAAIPFGGRSLQVVGVVNQARLYNLHEDGRPQVYVRAEDWAPYMPLFVVKTTGDPQALVPDVRRVIRQTDPRIPVSLVRTMDEIVDDALRQQRISAALIGGFGVGALLLVAMGLFGMVSGAVVRRTGELAVRLALGATPRRVLRLVMSEGALLVVIGIVLAIPGIYLLGGSIRGLLVDVSPWDPVTLSLVAAALFVVTMAACYVPARRVLAIDPAPLLRHD